MSVEDKYDIEGLTIVLEQAGDFPEDILALFLIDSEWFGGQLEKAKEEAWDQCVEQTVSNVGPGVADTIKKYNPHRQSV